MGTVRNNFKLHVCMYVHHTLFLYMWLCLCRWRVYAWFWLPRPLQGRLTNLERGILQLLYSTNFWQRKTLVNFCLSAFFMCHETLIQFGGPPVICQGCPPICTIQYVSWKVTCHLWKLLHLSISTQLIYYSVNIMIPRACNEGSICTFIIYSW